MLRTPTESPIVVTNQQQQQQQEPMTAHNHHHFNENPHTHNRSRCSSTAPQNQRPPVNGAAGVVGATDADDGIGYLSYNEVHNQVVDILVRSNSNNSGAGHPTALRDENHQNQNQNRSTSKNRKHNHQQRKMNVDASSSYYDSALHVDDVGVSIRLMQCLNNSTGGYQHSHPHYSHNHNQNNNNNHRISSSSSSHSFNNNISSSSSVVAGVPTPLDIKKRGIEKVGGSGYYNNTKSLIPLQDVQSRFKDSLRTTTLDTKEQDWKRRMESVKKAREAKQAEIHRKTQTHRLFKHYAFEQRKAQSSSAAASSHHQNKNVSSHNRMATSSSSVPSNNSRSGSTAILIPTHHNDTDNHVASRSSCDYDQHMYYQQNEERAINNNNSSSTAALYQTNANSLTRNQVAEYFAVPSFVRPLLSTITTASSGM